MDVISSGNSESDDFNSFCDVSVDQPQSICSFTGDLSANELASSLTEFLSIQDEKSAPTSIELSEKSDIGNLKNEETSEDFRQTNLASVTSEKCLKKCATFPFSGKNTSSIALRDGKNEKDEEKREDEDDITAEVLAKTVCAKSVNPLCPPRLMSLPTPLKLVSAMKGSREKQGMLPKKLTVTWAPDVYDPLPTAVSHVATSNSYRHRKDSKKNGKNKQKGSGKSSRGSRAKDKKQTRKHSGSSNRCLKMLGDNESVINYGEPQAESIGFDVGSPDAFCGHSFLKKSVTKLHFSVAEAT